MPIVCQAIIRRGANPRSRVSERLAGSIEHVVAAGFARQPRAGESTSWAETKTSRKAANDPSLSVLFRRDHCRAGARPCVACSHIYSYQDGLCVFDLIG